MGKNQDLNKKKRVFDKKPLSINSGKLRIKPQSSKTLGQLYDEMKKRGKIGVGRDAVHAERIPVAIHVERTQYETYPKYNIFLKCQCQERNQEYHYSIEPMEYNTGLEVKEKSFEWSRGVSVKERTVWRMEYPLQGKIGEKERGKRMKKVEKAARDMLFESVMSTAIMIINYYSQDRMLPLIWHEHPGGIRRRYEDAKEVVYKMRRQLRNKGA